MRYTKLVTNNKLRSTTNMNSLEKEIQKHNELSKERGPFLASKSMRKSKSSNRQWVMPSYSKWIESTSDQSSDNSKIIQVLQVLQSIYQKLVIILLHA